MKSDQLKVFYVAAECKPFSKVGGVADVAGELPLALKKQGVDVTVVTPLYDSISASRFELMKKYEYEIDFEERSAPFTVWEGNLNDIPVLFIQNQEYLSKGPYVYSTEFPYKDDGKRFSFFAKAALLLIRENVQIVHGNDWMTGYLFGMMATEKKPQKRVLTIHNAGYQGNMPITRIQDWEIAAFLNSNIADLFKDPHEEWHNVNPLRLALELSHAANAVSPTYAKELLQPEESTRFFEGGKGLEEICRRLTSQGRLTGILNGFNYGANATEEEFKKILRRKEESKRELSVYFEKKNEMLIGFVGRAVEQKFRLLAEQIDGKPVLEHILDIPGINLAIVSSGEKEYESFIANLSLPRFQGELSYSTLLQRLRRQNYAAFTAFDKTLATRVSSASDVFLMPSLFEPCGITQLEAMNNATPPLVRWTGGLCDTVKDYTDLYGTGFGFDGNNKEEILRNLIATVKKARETWDKPDFRRLQKNAFFERFTWEDTAKEYVKLYESAMRR